MAAALGEDQFSATLLYALEQLGTPNISLKDEQTCSIRAAFSGKDVFVCLPTGFGKSLCYQVLPFMFDHKAGLLGRNVVVVVSPLKALMADQIKSLRDSGVKAVVISSGSKDTFTSDFIASESILRTASLIFCSPEALISPKWRVALEKPNISDRVCAVAVDEAHCISKWYVT